MFCWVICGCFDTFWLWFKKNIIQKMSTSGNPNGYCWHQHPHQQQMASLLFIIPDNSREEWSWHPNDALVVLYGAEVTKTFFLIRPKHFRNQWLLRISTNSSRPWPLLHRSDSFHPSRLSWHLFWLPWESANTPPGPVFEFLSPWQPELPS